MPIISVLTPAQKSRSELLVDAGHSVSQQQLPPSWTLEWLVQEDGDDPALGDAISIFPFASYEANGRQLGEGPTRNLALNRARGELVHVLDCDDLLLPDALLTAIEIFTRHPEIHWVAGRADDLLEDGSRVPVPLSVPPGFIGPGALSATMCQGSIPQWPVHTAGLTIRRSTVHALGGWGSYPCGADVCLFSALSELTPGYLPATVTWLYRKHPGQVTASRDWKDLTPTIVRKRIEAIRELGLSLSATPITRHQA